MPRCLDGACIGRPTLLVTAQIESREADVADGELLGCYRTLAFRSSRRETHGGKMPPWPTYSGEEWAGE